MAPTFRIRPATGVPDGARVCHYDELEEPAKESFPALAGSASATTTDAAFESTADSCDLVKFTDYYEIERV
jgi:hypothetical protein